MTDTLAKSENIFHYSIKKIPKILKRDYRARLAYTELANKPQGFWVCFESPDSETWFDVCDNDVMRYRIKHKYRVYLDPEAKYLTLSTKEEVDEFSDRFGYWRTYVPSHPLQQVKDAQTKAKSAMGDLAKMINIDRQPHMCDRLIDWNWVMGIYKGIIINPYLYERRYTYLWYNAWDCPSGCIWDTNCIKRIEYVKG